MTRHRYVVVAGLVCLAALLTSTAYYSGALTTVQDRVFDRFSIAKAPPSDMVVIGIDDESIQALGGWPFSRATLAKALDTLSGAKAVGLDIVLADPSPLGAADDRVLADALTRAKAPVTLSFLFDERGGKTTEPLALFAAHAKRGYANVVLDSDGVVRRFEATRQGAPSLSAALLSPATPPPGSIRIDYYGPAQTFLTIPFIDLYQGKVPPSALKDKLVLVGATAPDLHDRVQSPFGALPGVEMQANALATLAAGVWFDPTWPPLTFIAIVLASVLGALIIVFVKRLSVLIVLLGMALASITLLAILLFGWHILFPNLAVSLACILSAGPVLVYQYLSESKEKKFIQETFQYYLMPAVIDHLIANPEKLALGGERRTLTILFSDIRGFTTISEGLTPEGLMEIMNEYLTGMTDIILSQRGLVDKYIGDAVMAFWGAPLENNLQAVDACHSVMLMAERLKELNTHWHSRGLPHLEIGVGLNRGEVIVGNMGSATRFNYTVMGDSVNFASRLEGLNKEYGTQCLISDSVQKEIAGESDLRTRELDLVIVKGKKEPKLIFELLTTTVDETFERVLDAFAQGRTEYVAGKWHDAISHFERALALRADGPSALYLARCRELLAHPPVDWDGVYEFKTK